MQIFIMYKSRKGTTQIGILEDPVLIQWSKWTSLLMGQIKITHHLTECSEKNIAPLLWCSCKTCITWNKSWGSIRHQIKGQLQNNWPVIFNSVKVIKVKERLKNCSRLELTRRANWNMWFWTGCVWCKEHHQDHEKTWMESENHMTVMYQCWFSELYKA